MFVCLLFIFPQKYLELNMCVWERCRFILSMWYINKQKTGGKKKCVSFPFLTYHNHANYKKFNENLCVNNGNIRVKVFVFYIYLVLFGVTIMMARGTCSGINQIMSWVEHERPFDTTFTFIGLSNCCLRSNHYKNLNKMRFFLKIFRKFLKRFDEIKLLSAK